jgi:hypothetical protein
MDIVVHLSSGAPHAQKMQMLESRTGSSIGTTPYVSPAARRYSLTWLKNERRGTSVHVTR